MNFLRAFRENVWAITPEGLLTISSVIDNKMSGSVDPELLKELKDNNKQANALSFLSASGSSFGSTSETQEENLTAIIPLKGPMFKSANLMSDISGARSMEQVMKDIKTANEDPRVREIVLELDTPGGTVDGTELLGKAVASSKKVLGVWGNGLIASAGVWASSGAKFIKLSGETAQMGSIGTLMWHTDASVWYASRGIKMTPITATLSKDKVLAPDSAPLTPEVIDKVKARLDPINEMFISAVKSGREGKLTSKEDLFTGKVFNGREAVSFGLADSIGSLDEAIAEARELSMKQSKIFINTNQNEASMNKPWTKVRAFLGLQEKEAVAMKEEDIDKLEAQLANSISLTDHSTITADLQNQIVSLKADLKKKDEELLTAQQTIVQKDAKIKELGEQDGALGTIPPPLAGDPEEKKDFATLTADFDHNKAADENPLIPK